MNNYKVSVITPIYNGMKHLPSLIKIIQEQTLNDFEWIVVNDCSSDDTKIYLESYRNNSNHRLHIINNDNNIGAAKSRNKGLEIATGEYICFLDVDDKWNLEKLQLQHKFMNANNIELSYTSYQRIDTHDKVLGTVNPPKRLNYDDLLKSNHIGNLTAMVRRDKISNLFISHGHEDYIFWLNILKNIHYAYRMDTANILCQYRVAPGSLSANKFKAASWQWKIYRHIEKISFFKSIYLFTMYSYFSIKKRI